MSKLFPLHYVYVVQEDGADVCKVGGMHRLTGRKMPDIQYGNPRSLTMVHHTERLPDHSTTKAIEYRAHEILRPHHIRGEWFRVSPATAIAAVQQATKDTYP
jgi:hypothetical protein